MRSFEFSMALSAEKTRKLYQGLARYIIVETDQGLKLQLPAANFRAHVDSDGIHGRFQARVDATNKLIALRKL